MATATITLRFDYDAETAHNQYQLLVIHLEKQLKNLPMKVTIDELKS